jgi:hypothetical protein
MQQTKTACAEMFCMQKGGEEGINEVYANVYQLTKPPTNYVSSKVCLIYHLHSSIIQHYNCITVGSHLCFKCLMLLNFSLKDDMTSNTQTSEYY